MKRIILSMFILVFMIGIVSAAWTSELDNGLKMYHEAEQTSGNLTDSTGQQDCEPLGTPSYSQTGKINNAVSTNSASGYFACSDTGSTYFDFGTGNFSVAVWFNQTNNASVQYLFALQSITDSSGAGLIGINPNGTITQLWNFGAWDGAWDIEQTSTQKSNFSQWNLLIINRKNGNFSIHLNNNTIMSSVNAGSLTSDRANKRTRFGSYGAQTYNGLFDEFAIWNRSLTDSDINNLWNGGLGSQRPYVTANSPSSNTVNKNVNFNCTAKAADGISNISLIINGTTNQTVNFGGNTSAQLYLNKSLGYGEYTWNCDMRTSLNELISSSSLNFNVTGIIENSQTFNTNVMEGTSESFTINLTKSSDYQVLDIDLIYNSTRYSSQFSSSGNEVMATASITIPSYSVLTNVSFYWEVLLSDNSLFNSTINNQSVNILQVDNCSSYSNLLYNYTLYDESTQEKLNNGTIELEIVFYNQLRTSQILNFSQKYSNIHSAKICLGNTLTPNSNYSIDSVVKYSSNETLGGNSSSVYSVEYYNILNEIIRNSSIPYHIKLYDILLADSTEFQLTFRDSSLRLAPDILVYVYRQYIQDGDFKIVEVPLTDSNGQTILHLVRNNVIYNLIMRNSNGETIATFNKIIAFCQDYTIGQCTINLNAPSTESSIYNYTDDLGISYTKPTYNNNTGIISLSFVTNNLLPKEVSINVIKSGEFGNRTACTDSLSSASGTLSCDVSSIAPSYRFLFVEVIVEGDLKTVFTIDLEQEDFNFGFVNGAFFAFLLILFLITMFIEDKQSLVISLGIGWAAVFSLYLLKGGLIGSATAGIWLIISIAIMLWKLRGEE